MVTQPLVCDAPDAGLPVLLKPRAPVSAAKPKVVHLFTEALRADVLADLGVKFTHRRVQQRTPMRRPRASTAEQQQPRDCETCHGDTRRRGVPRDSSSSAGRCSGYASQRTGVERCRSESQWSGGPRPRYFVAGLARTAQRSLPTGTSRRVVVQSGSTRANGSRYSPGTHRRFHRRHRFESETGSRSGWRLGSCTRSARIAWPTRPHAV